MNIKLEFYKDEQVIKEKINCLETLTREQVCKIESLHIEDLYFMSAIDK